MMKARAAPSNVTSIVFGGSCSTTQQPEFPSEGSNFRQFFAQTRGNDHESDMDLLGSILNSMDKPPAISDRQKALLKKIRDDQERRQKVKAERLKVFREKIEEMVNEFLRDETAKDYQFPPMDQVHRSIVHDVAEIASVWAYSFGEEGTDRHIVIFKREHAPSEDHLNALRRGEKWSEEIGKNLKEARERQAKEDAEASKSRKRKNDFVPNSNYKDKYEHLIGKESALEAARKTEANSSYGCVPSENKKDQRSIEQTLADIRAKKKKLEAATEIAAPKDGDNTE